MENCLDRFYIFLFFPIQMFIWLNYINFSTFLNLIIWRGIYEKSFWTYINKFEEVFKYFNRIEKSLIASQIDNNGNEVFFSVKKPKYNFDDKLKFELEFTKKSILHYQLRI